MLRKKIAMLAAGSAAVLALGGFAATPASAAPARVLADVGDFEDALGVKTGDVLDTGCLTVPANSIRAVLNSGSSITLYLPADTTCTGTPIGPFTGTAPAVGGFHYIAT
ncbi:hypothetical protein [Streptomyces sp. NBC_01233]|uniref:hypothetical protein n=1 Tax=Streptomyces sp. NBC_01233 TaxID=2903787 RepID=UPI002E10DF45|nr:hypothetical protein OG332_26920 [Streptomyces sp. NBC_01233]